MLIVACVEWGNYQERGAEYVAKLRAGVARHLSGDFAFHILTDEPHRYAGLKGTFQRPLAVHRITYGRGGWWNKVELFRPDLFPLGARILFLDLDTLVVGSLDEVVEHKGIVYLRDWGWSKDDYCSCVMLWDAGEHAEIWTRYDAKVPGRYEGDQDWIRALDEHPFGRREWPALSSVWMRSHRYHAKAGIPEGCRVVNFHGRPKPHELTTGWAADLWRSLA